MAPASQMDRGSEKPGTPAEKPTSVLLVERTTHQDVPAICSLLKKVWEPAPARVPVELVKAWQPTPLEFTSWMGGVTYFSARKDGHLVGVVGGELHHGSCRLVHLAVDPDIRRNGVATALVAALGEWAKKANAASLWVDVLHGLAPASALFPHLGFALVGTFHRHEWGEDVALFERVL